jgi:hypothetical protein
MMSDADSPPCAGGPGMARAGEAVPAPPHGCTSGYLTLLSEYTGWSGAAWAEYGCEACRGTFAVPAGPPGQGGAAALTEAVS